MNIYAFGPIAGLLSGAYDAVLSVAHLLVPLIGTPGFALAIVGLTLAVRGALLPLAIAAAKADVGRRRLAPDLTALRRRFASDPARLQRETVELYRREGVSPLAGILPVLAQAPILGLLYGLVTQPVIGGHGNELVSHVVGGAPLAVGLLSDLGTVAWPGMLVNLAVFAVMIVIAELSRREANRRLDLQPPAAVVPPAASGVAGADPMRIARAMSWLSYLSAVFSVIVPLAAAIYLATSALWTLIERRALRHRFGPHAAG